MKPILHIIRNSSDTQAIELIEQQSKDNAYGVTAVFTQEIASLPSIPNARICVLKEDVGDKTIHTVSGNGIDFISFKDLLNIIFSVESVTVW